jgi:uncharacterized protein with gpF-like domain
MPAEWTPLPPLEALAFFARKTGYTPAWSWQEIYGDEHKAAFTVAKMMQLDLLKQVREEVDRAIAGKVTLQDFQKNLMPILKRAGWWGTQETDGVTVQLGSPERLKVIFDTNVRQAYHAGAWERAQRTKQDIPYLIYELGPSREHRPEHVHWAGTVLPIDDPWWQSHHPMNGWGCKCSTRQLTAEQAQQEGYTPGRRPAFEDEKVPWTNKATGVTRQVPRGIDPGFENNPGERMGTLEARMVEKEAAYSGTMKATTNQLENTCPG